MQKTLIINAHPDYSNRQHHSTQLEDYFQQQLREKFPDAQITLLNLYEEDIPQINQKTYEIYRRNAACLDLTSDEKAVFERSNFLLQQFKDHHRIVISSPLHNFNVTARLKDYLDNIMVARETYRYTETGSVGMMTDDYKVFYLQSSGSIYTNHDRYTPLEFSNFYLKEMFENIMGFDKYYIARSQGTDILGADQAAILQQAKDEIDAVLAEFYQRK